MVVAVRRAGFIAGCAFALLLAACGGGGGAYRTAERSRSTAQSSEPHTASTKKITFNGVQLTIPASWPVIDGAHTRHTCSSTFLGQADRAFLGISYQGAPSCPTSVANTTPPADGVWMQPAGAASPQQTPTTLPGGQRVDVSSAERASAVSVWYHHVMIQIGIGAKPAVERAILNSITYSPTTADSPVLAPCPASGPTPPAMPAPSRLTAPLVLDDSNGQMQPEPPNVQPKVSAARIWNSFVHGFGADHFGALQWSIVLGSYSAKTPAKINPDGSTTPEYRGVPTWLIRGQGVPTDHGPCGITVLAPYNAGTGHSMTVTTLG